MTGERTFEPKVRLVRNNKEFSCCPVCDKLMRKCNISRHLEKIHRLLNEPHGDEVEQLRQQYVDMLAQEKMNLKSKSRQSATNMTDLKEEIRDIAKEIHNSGAGAGRRLKQILSTHPELRRFADKAINNKEGRFSKSSFPLDGRSVQGGSPGLGKKA